MRAGSREHMAARGGPRPGARETAAPGHPGASEPDDIGRGRRRPDVRQTDHEPGLLRRGATRRRSASMLAAALVLVLACASTRVQAAGAGMFRFGHISWEAHGSEVSFTIETAFRKSVTAKEWLNAKIGDHLLLFGREAPQFLYGDSQFASSLTMQVTAVSEAEDWVMGVIHLKHTYATPNNQARPWRAQYVGCCRVSDLKNNADMGFQITAEVDLTATSRSPRAATLPVITVPMVSRPAPGAPADAPPASPAAYIPSRTGSRLHWDVGTPIDVGSAAALTSGDQSYLELPLGPLWTGDTCADSSTGAACLVQMLSADPLVGGGAAALTVEGWVKLATRQGGYILSTSHASPSGRRVSTL